MKQGYCRQIISLHKSHDLAPMDSCSETFVLLMAYAFWKILLVVGNLERVLIMQDL